jgi:F-type H+-transporting ATPase subunit b
VLIDGFTVIAQIVNFLVLVALLKHFLYDRVLAAMDEREDRIRKRLASAERERSEAEEEAQDYRRRKAQLEDERARVLDEARRKAEERRETLVAEARREIDGRRRAWEEALAAEKEEFLRELGRRASAEVYAAARHALRSLADADLEKRVLEVFLDRLADAGDEVRDALRRAAADGGNRLAVRSGFELSSDQRRKVTRGLHETVAEGVDVDYETDPDLLLGVEVAGRGHRVAWHVRDHLDTLRERAAEMFAEAAARKEEAPEAAGP